MLMKNFFQFPGTETRYLSRQPVNRGESEKEGELKSSTAVGFGQATSRKVFKKALPAPPPPSLSTSQITSDILNSSADSPSALSPLVVKKQQIKKSTISKGLFNAMHETGTEQVINFDENVKVCSFYFFSKTVFENYLTYILNILKFNDLYKDIIR
jgi:hypothetical protein